jgi:hypothetical protein
MLPVQKPDGPASTDTQVAMQYQELDTLAQQRERWSL